MMASRILGKINSQQSTTTFIFSVPLSPPLQSIRRSIASCSSRCIWTLPPKKHLSTAATPVTLQSIRRGFGVASLVIMKPPPFKVMRCRRKESKITKDLCGSSRLHPVDAGLRSGMYVSEDFKKGRGGGTHAEMQMAEQIQNPPSRHERKFAYQGWIMYVSKS